MATEIPNHKVTEPCLSLKVTRLQLYPTHKFVVHRKQIIAQTKSLE